MPKLPFGLRPLSSAADLAIVVGAGGLVTGMGGRYFFMVPVLEGAGGQPLPQGYWGQPPYTSTTYGGTGGVSVFSEGGLRMLGMLMFGLTAEQAGAVPPLYDGNPALNFVQANSTYTWGPLGSRSGFIFVALIAGGIVLRLM